MTEPLAWNVLSGGDLYYPSVTDSPVTAIRVARRGSLLLMIWASDDDKAADTIAFTSGGDLAANAGVQWGQQLRAAKARGLGPLAAIRELWGTGKRIRGFGAVDVKAGFVHSDGHQALEKLVNP